MFAGEVAAGAAAIAAPLVGEANGAASSGEAKPRRCSSRARCSSRLRSSFRCFSFSRLLISETALSCRIDCCSDSVTAVSSACLAPSCASLASSRAVSERTLPSSRLHACSECCARTTSCGAKQRATVSIAAGKPSAGGGGGADGATFVWSSASLFSGGSLAAATIAFGAAAAARVRTGNGVPRKLRQPSICASSCCQYAHARSGRSCTRRSSATWRRRRATRGGTRCSAAGGNRATKCDASCVRSRMNRAHAAVR
eukprot:763408-Prymnesium_polylepis.3